MAAPSSTAAISINPDSPTVPIRSALSSGPHSPPTLAPAAMKANSRRAWAPSNTSAIRLQATETTNRL